MAQGQRNAQAGSHDDSGGQGKRVFCFPVRVDVIEPDDGVCAIGSGGNYALAAAKALLRNTDLSAKEIAKKALEIASEICVFTNGHITVEEA